MTTGMQSSKVSMLSLIPLCMAMDEYSGSHVFPYQWAEFEKNTVDTE